MKLGRIWVTAGLTVLAITSAPFSAFAGGSSSSTASPSVQDPGGGSGAYCVGHSGQFYTQTYSSVINGELHLRWYAENCTSHTVRYGVQYSTPAGGSYTGCALYLGAGLNSYLGTTSSLGKYSAAAC